MTLSATIPVEHMGAANAELEGNEVDGFTGFGPGNFSVPLRNGNAEATHAGLHAWDDPAFEAAIEALDYPGLVIRHDPGTTVNFKTHVQEQASQWEDPSNWFDNPVMTGDQRTHDGKTWESLTDYNVWQPPVGWREVTAGVAAWIQPTSAVDAYQTGELVTHDNPNDGGTVWVYRSKIDANTTEPGRDGTFDRWWEPVARESDYTP